MTLNDIAADRQQWRNLAAASMAEISWTMNTLPDHDLTYTAKFGCCCSNRSKIWPFRYRQKSI